jgi:hypothetical protein
MIGNAMMVAAPKTARADNDTSIAGTPLKALCGVSINEIGNINLRRFDPSVLELYQLRELPKRVALLPDGPRRFITSGPYRASQK